MTAPHHVPLGLTRPPVGSARRAARYWALVRSFVLNDIQTRYVGSLVGFFWTVIQPLIELLTYTFVFTVILRVRFADEYSTATNALFLFCGMVPWFSISESITRSTSIVRENAHLIKKLRFPASALPMYVVLSEAFNGMVRFVLLFGAVLLVGQGLSVHALLFVAVLFVQLFFTLGLCMLVATTQVFFKDTQHLLQPVLLIWLFITPIFYPASLFPKEFTPLRNLNPLSHLVGIYRELILNHRLPDWGSMVIFGSAAALTFVLGWATFQRHSREFPDLV